MFAGNPMLSRLLAVTLLVAVIAGVWSALAAPLIEERRSQKAEIERAMRLIEGFESRREDIGALKRRLAALRDDPTAGGAYFTARNVTLAIAKLQSRIKTITEATGARLTSTQVVTTDGGKPDADRKGPERITVTATMVGPIEAVRTIFHTLESGKPFVFLDDISITARIGARRSVPPNSTTGPLTVRYSAYGFLWRGKDT